MSIFQPFPFVLSEEPRQIVEVLRQIVAIRSQDLPILNNILSNASYEGGFKRSTLSITSSTAIGAEQYWVDVDTTGGAVTVTLPLTPVDGETHVISKKNAGANAITIDGNGKNVNGAASINFNTQYQGRLLSFVGAASEWRALTL